MDQAVGAWAQSDTQSVSARRRAGLVRLLGVLHKRGYRFVTPSPATQARVLRHRAGEMAITVEDALGWNMPFDDDLLPSELFACLLDAAAIRATDHGWLARIRVSALANLRLSCLT